MSDLFRLRAVLRAPRTAATVVGLCALALVGGAAHAAAVKGTLRGLEVEVTSTLLGFTRTRVAPPAEWALRRERPVAVFLAVRDGESFPIPEPSDHQIITIEGLRFVPNIASCASDAQVSFVNADQGDVTVTIDGRPLGTIPPGGQKTYVCSPGATNRIVRVTEWPHMRAMVYVGEVGVAGAPDERGRFKVELPQGKYELRVVTIDGAVMTREIEIERRDVDLGKLVVASPVGERTASE